MSLIFITGIPGAGKTSVCRELKARGCQAYDTDADLLAGWYDKSTRLPVAMPPREIWASQEWRDQHNWHFDRKKFEVIAAANQSNPVFICGSAANEVEVWDLFSTVAYLLVDEATLRARLSSRTDNEFGKEPHELDAILSWLQNAEADYTRFGAKIIDASRPLKHVVDEIMSLCLQDGIPER